MLYEYFNTTFWEKIEEVGLERIQAMVEKIQKLSADLKETCVRGSGTRKAWNGKLIPEPKINPDKKDDLNCMASILWGTSQSEFLKQRQLELIKKENWARTP